MANIHSFARFAFCFFTSEGKQLLLVKDANDRTNRTVKEYLTVQTLHKGICNFCILLFQTTTGYFPKSDIFYEILGNYPSKIADNSPNLKILVRFGNLCIQKWKSQIAISMLFSNYFRSLLDI